MAGSFPALPEELLRHILIQLEKPALFSLALTSSWGHLVASPWIWKEVTLVDCRHDIDEHDDTPIIKKLIILATNPTIASCVEILHHQCHLPAPAIFSELPRRQFSSQTLSCDPRTIHLVKAATKHMSRVHTLRIINGHPNLNDALVRCLFDKDRKCQNPVRRLWLECCRLPSACDPDITASVPGLPLLLDFDHLESIRLRRMAIRPGRPTLLEGENYPRVLQHYVASRSTFLFEARDGQGGTYSSSFNRLSREQGMWYQPPEQMQGSLRSLFDCANRWDDALYDRLADELTEDELALVISAHIRSHDDRNTYAYRGRFLDPLDFDNFFRLCPDEALAFEQERERRPSNRVFIAMLGSAARTLTSLCLDWILTGALLDDERNLEPWIESFIELFDLRFPCLRAFQFRNAILKETQIPHGIYLLDHCTPQRQYRSLGEAFLEPVVLSEENSSRINLGPLKFLENHPQLQCLAWPMDRFFSENPPSEDVCARADTIIDTLDHKLVDLRVDAHYLGPGERVSEEQDCKDIPARDRRRKFIKGFACRMTRLKQFKLEGGIPRDERRECIRALHQCPLEKLVLIGVSCPLGNTWGSYGSDVIDLLDDNDDVEVLESENKSAVWSLGARDPDPISENFQFEPIYGWPAQAPMLHTIASFHASTITELKTCGSKGSPLLLSPTPITTPLFAALKHFHQLRTLVLSLWLTTRYEQSSRDHEIINYWLAARNPNSTALVRVTDEEPEGWELELRTKYAPDALAWRVASFIGPWLSEQAKSRPGGVNVRASFIIGEDGGIFDIDVLVARGAMGSSVCLGYEGPRAEGEKERKRGKLVNRGWF